VTAPVLPEEVLDQRMVGALRDFGREPGALLEEMVHGFLVEAPALVAEIERAVADHDGEAVARTAHRLKGASGHVGATRLVIVAGVVEAAGRAGNQDAIETASTTVRRELVLALAAARALLPPA
jgi:HPt (histidine-containing phosphotransfer) domain-containing protein